MVEKNVAGRRRPNNQTQSSKTSSFDKAKCLLPTKISALQFVEKCQKSRQEKIYKCDAIFFQNKNAIIVLAACIFHFNSSSYHVVQVVPTYSAVHIYICRHIHMKVQYRYYILQYTHTHIVCISLQKLGIGKHPSTVACNFLTVPCQKIACENVQKT